jgi:peptidoglycan/LPS O-acetylase OafA/YrhL
MTNEKSIYRFQGLFRLILAMMVLWGHSIMLFFPELTWFPKLQFGNVAVSCFFVLSGYLMTAAVYLWYKNKLLSFITNRYLRISPPLFVAGVFSIVSFLCLLKLGFPLDYWEPIPPEWISLDNMIRTLLSPLFPLNQVLENFFNLSSQNTYNFVRYSWAIYVEFFFYWLLFSYFLLKKLLNQKGVAIFSLILITLMSVAGIVYHEEVNSKASSLLGKIPLITAMKWIPQFLLGVVLCEIERNKTRNIWLKILFFLSIIGALIQLCLFAKADFIIVGLLYLVTLFLGFLSIMNKKQEFRVGSFLINKKIDNKIGSLSYPVYINHYAIGLLFFNILAGLNFFVLDQPFLLRLFLFIFFNIIVICISKILINITDMLTDSLRDRIRGQKL